MKNLPCERLICYGHSNVRALHRSTFEITKEESLTSSGTCIIAIQADKGICELDSKFRTALASDSALLVTTLTAGTESCTIKARGSSRLILNHPTDLVWRRSSYIDSRTIAIHADNTAETLPRNLVAALVKEEKMTVDMKIFTIPEEERSSVPQIQAFFHNFV
ncbi:DUF371 domain-containing protein [Methanogenium organophilum]|uniref:DUF371 domain-containing protein n=1 Tax=Methanogenium organophilum TaxID=2199 RepID=A0A9X9S3C2_METOG|nr:DUF371 domain-containing protein [Methanogenium organophilum]WAI00727.1 DUF371 domain-containing protein [Methanogenium organophilum]